MKVKSDLARNKADIFAMAASMSFITTRVAKGVYAGEWQITVAGLKWLDENEEE